MGLPWKPLVGHTGLIGMSFQLVPEVPCQMALDMGHGHCSHGAPIYLRFTIEYGSPNYRIVVTVICHLAAARVSTQVVDCPLCQNRGMPLMVRHKTLHRANSTPLSSLQGAVQHKDVQQKTNIIAAMQKQTSPNDTTPFYHRPTPHCNRRASTTQARKQNFILRSGTCPFSPVNAGASLRIPRGPAIRIHSVQYCHAITLLYPPFLPLNPTSPHTLASPACLGRYGTIKDIPCSGQTQRGFPS
jgi:hypothetical protein